jgi:hypothetical protein
VSFQSTKARAKEVRGRDTAEEVAYALQLYADDTGGFPSIPMSAGSGPIKSDHASWTTVWEDTVTSGYMSKAPKPSDDPRDPYPYAYYVTAEGEAVFIVHSSNPGANSCHPFASGSLTYSTESCAPPNTLPGDANSDGVIDEADYEATDHGYNAGLSGWANGDFDCDGLVTFDDYSIIDMAYARQGGKEVPTLCTDESEEFCVCVK